jgi:pimeloyl-ACP methyl ester carboxylesterase
LSGQPHAFSEGYVDAAGNRIHFVEQGCGSPVLLIHGAYSSGTEFLQKDFGKVVAERFRVVAPDSLAHGCSDSPADPMLFGARRRALHLAAVLDALGIERAHVIGYSMGGWMASAFTAFHPNRVASLAIGGWDVVNGMYTPAAAWGLPKITGEMLNAMARRDHPELMTWVRPEHEVGLAAAVDGMNDLVGLAEAVAHCAVPVTFWVGKEDLYYDAVVRFATASALSVITLPGDHISMLEQHGAEAARRVGNFIEGVDREMASTSNA